MANDYMDYFTINGVEVHIQDYGRDKPNGVPVLDPQGKLPAKYLSGSYANSMPVSPDDPYEDNLVAWTTKLSSNQYREAGKNWQSTTGDFWGGDFHAGLLVCCKDSELVYSEDNGTTFTTAISSSDFGRGTASYLNGLWIAVSANGIWTSENGKNFTKKVDLSETLGSVTNRLYALFIDGAFYVLAKSKVYRSVDGENWSLVIQDTSSSSTLFFSVILKKNNRMIAIKSGSRDTYSSDDNGVTWTIHSNAIPSNYSNQMFYGTVFNDLFIISGGQGGICYSSDGLTWTSVYLSGGVAAGVLVNCGTYLLYSLSGGRIARSSDGTSWTQIQIVESGVNYAFLAYSPSLDIVIWAPVKSTAATVSPFRYSINRGETWQEGSYDPSLAINFGTNATICVTAPEDGTMFILSGTGHCLLFSGVPMWIPPME